MMATAAEPAPAHWQWELSGGYDGTRHSYALAVDDTTETISEVMFEAALEGRSGRGADHRWRLRSEASAGTELYRQRVDADWRIAGERGRTPLRLEGTLAARQYRRGTEYVYSSDNWESRLGARAQPLAWSGSLLEVRAKGALQQYRTPSTLEVNWRQAEAGAYLRSRSLAEHWWSAGLSVLRRAYPDTAQIDRDQLGVELDWDSGPQDQGGLRVHHKTERRRSSPTRRCAPRPGPTGPTWRRPCPTAPAGWWASSRARSGATTTRPRPGSTPGAWRGCWATAGATSWRPAGCWGWPRSTWPPATVPTPTSSGACARGVDAFGLDVSGSLTVEYGRRFYRDPTIVLDDGSRSGVESFALYSDFNYWKVWLTGSWRLSDAFSLDALASYEPERHTEPADDSSLGFVNLRLVWRP